MFAKIYQPSKTAMQSGNANTKSWILEFETEVKKFNDPLMGWVGSSDMNQEVKLYFDSKEAAIAFAKEQGIEFQILLPKQRKITPKSYAENFK